jgi:DNA repair photolyase
MQIREVEVRHILTRSKLSNKGYTINPYVGCQHACVYCYACFMKRLTNHEEPWGQFVDVKANAVEAFENDFRKVKDGEGTFVGSATDAYQPLEAKYELTRGILQKIVDSQAASLFPKEFSVSILTKSDLVLRDLDLLKRIPGIEVGFSIAMPNEQARRIFEPCCVPVKQRFKALQTLCDNNINTFAFIGPILPGITDLEMIFASLEGKVTYVFGETLNTHCGNMPQILKAVTAYDQKLRPFFVQAVKDRQYWESVEEEFYALAKKHDIHVAGFFHHVRKSGA